MHRAPTRNDERRYAYAQSNPYVAWVLIHADVLAWEQEEQLLVGAPAILAVVDDLTIRWLNQPRPRKYGLRQFITRYLYRDVVDDRSDDSHTQRRAAWAAHVAKLRGQTLPPFTPTRTTIGRIAAYALCAADTPGPGHLTRNLIRRYGAHTIAALFDARVLEPGDTPLTTRVTDLGRRVLDVLVGHGVTSTGCDIDLWRRETRAAVAAIVKP